MEDSEADKTARALFVTLTLVALIGGGLVLYNHWASETPDPSYEGQAKAATETAQTLHAETDKDEGAIAVTMAPDGSLSSRQAEDAHTHVLSATALDRHACEIFLREFTSGPLNVTTIVIGGDRTPIGDWSRQGVRGRCQTAFMHSAGKDPVESITVQVEFL